MIIVIEGDPIVKKRHKMTTIGGYIRSYDPQEKDKNQVASIMFSEVDHQLNHPDSEMQLDASNLVKGERFHVDLTFYLDLPKSLSNSKRNAILWGSDEYLPNKDIDNLVKFYLDCGNTILYPDDRMISKLNVNVEFSTKPLTVINIMPKKACCSSYNKILAVYTPKELSNLIDESAELCLFFEQYQIFQRVGSDKQVEDCKDSLASCLKKIAITHAPLLKKIMSLSKHECEIIPLSSGESTC
jgi:Holliday junction resolvase RusA-like endonuclease